MQNGLWIVATALFGLSVGLGSIPTAAAAVEDGFSIPDCILDLGVKGYSVDDAKSICGEGSCVEDLVVNRGYSLGDAKMLCCD